MLDMIFVLGLDRQTETRTTSCFKNSPRSTSSLSARQENHKHLCEAKRCLTGFPSWFCLMNRMNVGSKSVPGDFRSWLRTKRFRPDERFLPWLCLRMNVGSKSVPGDFRSWLRTKRRHAEKIWNYRARNDVHFTMIHEQYVLNSSRMWN